MSGIGGNPSLPDIASALADMRGRIAVACRKAGRDQAEITLIAVSKTQSASRALECLAAGQRHFGENRIQEATAKWPELRQTTSDLCLHLIGPLQSNKAEEAVALFDVIHTLDRARLAEKLSGEMTRQSRWRPCFIQVNTGREPQKAGIDPGEADQFITTCREQWKLPIVGLMCLPPVDEQAAVHFAFLREIALRNGLAQLSMGMSDDFESAIAFGATHIRVGSAIFGTRL